MQDFSQAMLQHRNKIQKLMAKENVEAIVITSISNLIYITGSVFEGYVYLPVEGEPTIMVKRPNNYTGNCIFIKNIAQIHDILLENGIKIPERVALEEDDISAGEWLKLKGILKLETVLPGSGLIKKARMVKTPYEIEMIRQGGKKHVQFISGVSKLFRPGMTDLTFMAKVECHARELGHLGMFRSFGFRMESAYGYVLAGDNAAAPSPYDFSMGGAGIDPSFPGGACGDVISEGQAVLVDVAGSFGAYLTDMTRIFSYGKLSDDAYRAHEVSNEIIATLETLGKPGVDASEMYNVSMEIVKKNGLENCFMGREQKARFVGHGLGLNMNESPVLAARSKDVLEENNIIAIEPKFVIDGVGAVGGEDTFLVTGNGLDCITSYNRDVIEFQF